MTGIVEGTNFRLEIIRFSFTQPAQSSSYTRVAVQQNSLFCVATGMN
jgi:hypothetical protein